LRVLEIATLVALAETAWIREIATLLLWRGWAGDHILLGRAKWRRTV
jgi:hypothetical protein